MLHERRPVHEASERLFTLFSHEDIALMDRMFYDSGNSRLFTGRERLLRGVDTPYPYHFTFYAAWQRLCSINRRLAIFYLQPFLYIVRLILGKKKRFHRRQSVSVLSLEGWKPSMIVTTVTFLLDTIVTHCASNVVNTFSLTDAASFVNGSCCRDKYGEVRA